MFVSLYVCGMNEIPTGEHMDWRCLLYGIRRCVMFTSKRSHTQTRNANNGTTIQRVTNASFATNKGTYGELYLSIVVVASRGGWRHSGGQHMTNSINLTSLT